MSIKDEVLKEFEPMKIYETQEELGDELEVFVGWDEEDVEKMIDRTIQRIEKLVKKMRVRYFDDDEYSEMPLIEKEELLKEIKVAESPDGDHAERSHEREFGQPPSSFDKSTGPAKNKR